ncbi:TetR/AcrR family transcriptional regulator [Dyella japonica]|uniref:TetR family transcriptional regulator n=1 Tax=Dyella japonica A8 TaxID=1217721 RepID=A0A075K2R9_9GAMM|nr:TetR/AcrR family transcriptional regulator [Dyella japonica]AIF48509.1 TetR family transcriptional regulator [Dyella japonica A8]
MRYDAEHKQKTRAKVLDVAAKAIRQEGPERIGVASVMAEAGLTHGGFYAHFKSKDELVAAAIERMFEESAARLRHELDGRDPAHGLAAYIDFYLSRKHRDARGAGCPMAALASDLPRLPEETRALFASGARRLADALAETFTAMGRAEPQALARSTVSELVGALSLARVETDAKRSDAILADSRQLLKQRLGLEQAP